MSELAAPNTILRAPTRPASAARDALTMVGRCLRLSSRNVDALVMSLMLPIMLMLMFVYRSIGTVLLTMVILFVGLATGRGVVALLGNTGIMGLSTFAVNLLTALAIAAGTDYAIFMVGRYQEGRERKERTSSPSARWCSRPDSLPRSRA